MNWSADSAQGSPGLSRRASLRRSRCSLFLSDFLWKLFKFYFLKIKTFLNFFLENGNFHFFWKMKTLKFPSRMNPSIVNNRARTVPGSDGKSTPNNQFTGFETKQCRLQTPDLVRLLCPRLPRENWDSWKSRSAAKVSWIPRNGN